jgi:hypothetical protein
MDKNQIRKGLRSLKKIEANFDWAQCNKLIENILAYKGDAERPRLLTSLSVSEAVVTALTIDQAYRIPVTGREALWKNCFHILCKLGNNAYGRARHDRLDLTNIASVLARFNFNDPSGVVRAMRFLTECFLVVNRRPPFNTFGTDWSRHPILVQDRPSELALRCVFTGVCTVFQKQIYDLHMPQVLFHVCLNELFHANRECAFEALATAFKMDFYWKNGGDILTDRLKKIHAASFLSKEALDNIQCVPKETAPATPADKQDMYAWKNLLGILQTAPENIDATYTIISKVTGLCRWFHIKDHIHFKQCVDALPHAYNKDQTSPEPDWVYSFRRYPPRKYRHAIVLLMWAEQIILAGWCHDALNAIDHIQQLHGADVETEIFRMYSRVVPFSEKHWETIRPRYVTAFRNHINSSVFDVTTSYTDKEVSFCYHLEKPENVDRLIQLAKTDKEFIEVLERMTKCHYPRCRIDAEYYLTKSKECTPT